MARSLGRYNEGMVSSLNFSRHITRLLRASQRRENKKSLRTEQEADRKHYPYQVNVLKL